MGPGDLSKALASLPPGVDSRLLVGRESFDDAGVFLLSDDLALVQTVDFFAPIVDDPYTFGQIAAANALSDVYAMGGRPATALNIVAFPVGKIPLEVLSSVLAGGHEKVHEAGAVVVGGHTVSDEEFKFGLSVTGTARPSELLLNTGAAAGDHLVLTKPLGTGILATAEKNGSISDATKAALHRSMLQLNERASQAAIACGVRCATDVTGFGMLGHALNIAKGSGARLRFDAAALPLLPDVERHWLAGDTTGGAGRNLQYVEPFTAFGAAAPLSRAVLSDPQTSGGLLLSIPDDRLADYLSRVPEATRVGEVVGTGVEPYMEVV